MDREAIHNKHCRIQIDLKNHPGHADGHQPYCDILQAIDQTIAGVIDNWEKTFTKYRATKKDNPDAECSECRNGVEQSRYWRSFGGENHGGIQLCDSCFEKLKSRLKEGV